MVERLNRSAYQMPASPELMQRTDNHGALKAQGLIKKVQLSVCYPDGLSSTYLRT